MSQPFLAKNKKTSNYLPYLMWFIPLIFFAYQFILRLWPGLLMQQIMTQFTIDASKFGIIAAFYYYGYASMQIPVALLLDRYGARVIVFLFALLCSAATILFTYSSHWYLACLGRFMVGAGSAVGFLGVSKVISDWFPSSQYTKMIALSFSIGLLGAIYGGKPVNVLIDKYQWQNVAVVLAMISLIIAMSAYCVLRLAPGKNKNRTNHESFTLYDFKKILSSPPLWLLALANLLLVGSLEGFSDVWGVPFLMTAYSISKNNAAQLVSFVFFGMIFGGPLLAWCSRKLGHYSVIALCGLGMTTIFVILLFSHHVHWWLLACLFFSLGLMCCYQVIVFAAGAELVPSHHLGVSIAFLNFINMLVVSFFHTLIGRLMDTLWSGTLNPEGIKLYSLAAYQNALMIIPCGAILGTIMVCLLAVLSYRKQHQYYGKLNES